jgi:CheY-like chemotaxis protein
MPGEKILVVDDDPDIVAYLCSLLEDHGFSSESASNSRLALKVLSTYRPDAVLVDVLMPGRSGLDLLVTLRRDPRWAGTPIVVVTGNDQVLEEDCQSYLGSHQGVRGPDGVLGKPIDPPTLLAVLRRVLARAGGEKPAGEA